MIKVQAEQRSMPDISPDKVSFVIEKSRMLQSEDAGAAPDASNPTDDGGVQILTPVAYAPIRYELAQFIESLDVDEQSALVALAWIGRGDFEPEHWEAAVQLARRTARRRHGRLSDRNPATAGIPGGGARRLRLLERRFRLGRLRANVLRQAQDEVQAVTLIPSLSRDASPYSPSFFASARNAGAKSSRCSAKAMLAARKPIFEPQS